MHRLNRVAAFARRGVSASLRSAVSVRSSVGATVGVTRSRAQFHSRGSLRNAADTPAPTRPALTTFSDEENELRDMVSKFARETIQPRVAQMDEAGSETKTTHRDDETTMGRRGRDHRRKRR